MKEKLRLTRLVTLGLSTNLRLPMKKQRGFTLLELMVTLVIAAILMMIAAPSFQGYVKRNAVQADTRLLLGAIAYARSEAVSRNAFVTICASANGISCSTSDNWSNGWIIFVDNGAGADPTDKANITLDGTEPVLRVNQKQSSTGILATDADGSAIRGVMFSSRGYMEGLKRATSATTVGTVSLQVCEPDGNASFARAVFIEISGRARESVDSNSDGVHEDIAGGSLSCPS